MIIWIPHLYTVYIRIIILKGLKGQLTHIFICLCTAGFMEQLDAKYILANDGKCPEKDMSPATLGLTNMAGELCNYLGLIRVNQG